MLPCSSVIIQNAQRNLVRFICTTRTKPVMWGKAPRFHNLMTSLKSTLVCLFCLMHVCWSNSMLYDDHMPWTYFRIGSLLYRKCVGDLTTSLHHGYIRKLQYDDWRYKPINTYTSTHAYIYDFTWTTLNNVCPSICYSISLVFKNAPNKLQALWSWILACTCCAWSRALSETSVIKLSALAPSEIMELVLVM